MKLSNENDNNINNNLDKGILLETKLKITKPSMYNVLLKSYEFQSMFTRRSYPHNNLGKHTKEVIKFMLKPFQKLLWL